MKLSDLPLLRFAQPIFDRIVDPDIDGAQNSLFNLFSIALFIAASVFVLAVIVFSLGGDLGTFGDFVGGVLNPALTFLTFMGLLITIVLQKRELKETRTEYSRSANALEAQLKSIDRQNFEATFFQMLNLHNSNVNAMDIHGRSSDIKGRDCFKYFSKQLRNLYSNETDAGIPDTGRILSAYGEFWDQWQQDLGHYFRYLYNVIRFIDESPADQIRYMKLLRAQLSNYELVIIFYNCLTENGRNFKLYVERYSLFDNLPDDLLFAPSHKGLFAPSAYDEKLSRMTESNKA